MTPRYARAMLHGFTGLLALSLAGCASAAPKPSPSDPAAVARSPSLSTAATRLPTQAPSAPLETLAQWKGVFEKGVLPLCEGEGWKVTNEKDAFLSRECLHPVATYPFPMERLVALSEGGKLKSLQGLATMTQTQGNDQASGMHSKLVAQPDCAYVNMQKSPLETRTMAYYTCQGVDAVWFLKHAGKRSFLAMMMMPEGGEDEPVSWLSDPHTAPLGKRAHEPLPFPAPDDTAPNTLDWLMYRPTSQLERLCQVPWEEGISEQGIPQFSCSSLVGSSAGKIPSGILTVDVLEGGVVGAAWEMTGLEAKEVEALVDSAKADAMSQPGCALDGELKQPSSTTILYICAPHMARIQFSSDGFALSRLPLPDSAFGQAFWSRGLELSFKHEVREFTQFVQDSREVIRARKKTLEALK